MDKTTKIIIIISVILIVAFFGIFFYNKRNKKATTAKTESGMTPVETDKSTASKIVDLSGDVLGTVADSGIF